MYVELFITYPYKIQKFFENYFFFVLQGLFYKLRTVSRRYKKGHFHYKKVKKGTPNSTYPYVHSFFTLVLTKQVFEKK